MLPLELRGNSISYDERYLAHHGIKGQKWGVRRFQNEDGSLTARCLLLLNKEGEFLNVLIE